MKIAIASTLILVLVSVIGVGYVALRGIGSATAWALEHLQPVVSDALAPGRETAQLQERFGRAIALVREGRVDGTSLSETLVWLPGALLDGQLDASEVEMLSAKLGRVVGPALEPLPSPDAGS